MTRRALGAIAVAGLAVELSGVASATVPFAATFSSAVNRGQSNDVSTAANLQTYNSPNILGADYDHLGPIPGTTVPAEGVVLCYTTAAGGAVNAFDLGAPMAGFAAPGAPTVTPTSSPSVGRRPAAC